MNAGAGTAPRNVLALVPPHVGGRRAATGLAPLFPDGVRVTVAGTADEDTTALREAHPLAPGLARLSAGHAAAASRREPVPFDGHGAADRACGRP
ncbi:hypothetical protein O1Q96_30020 [Streptomyces sp. Qhu-G9]|uniref:hypothetical protein n=1 Tax=Streptomyces sp. Qhu-G9 TaxID=3452799 RepID=UPI0022AC537D|nr:hypothetical protein [Streptomyces aurantiacus]WAU83557.1 hypothetical protein O1Q96_30020 [Streptomyces aurantiacus]